MRAQMLPTLRVVLAVGMVMLGAVPPQAQDLSGLDLVAAGVAAFQATKDVCEYAPAVAATIDKIDRAYSDNYGERWDLAKRRGASMLGPLQNMATMLGGSGSTDNCKSLGIPVGDAIGVSILIVGLDPAAAREAERLSGGGGRKRTTKSGSLQPTVKSKLTPPAAVQDMSQVAAEAKAQIREVLARDLSNVLVAIDKAHDGDRFLTPDLNALYDKHARDFDADPYTGGQEPASYKLASLTANAPSSVQAVVNARFDVTGFTNEHPEIAYVLLRTANGWLIDDIIYMDDAKSMREILNTKPRTGK